MTRYHTAQKVNECRICGKNMQYGKRVNIQLSYELGDRKNRVSTSGHVCQKCAGEILKSMNLKRPR